ncbi:right-handed parallel beta-helix repeat-containing protein [Paenibacillus sp. LHD-117]|uniref:right-handed parallel beta-helix repeat-containing protein n=1 Tax=Paenibacillus sp. LHD-117 TaxID=3071412 RepID=UPI0027E197EF|nr:right-handed parallel beta-helix repeat-containing protein [Paenibacillus sp. LHD-117]MDQ6418529.1 right-handed parallel beta-helix repeat-containing protein [Paenibacillus sp. LHD-117]
MKYIVWSLLIAVHVSIVAAASLGKEAAFVQVADKRLNGETAAKTERPLPEGAANVKYQEKPHVIDLAKWGIRNDGTKPVETTRGINKALAWAKKSGITAVKLPPGTYLIDKNSRIDMVGNMLLDLTDKVTLQKETNGKESYQLLNVGYGANNVTIRGGVIKGDKDSHDYSKRDSSHTAGTHEGGYGISVIGAEGVTIEGVTATHFTGDGLVLGAHGTMVHDLYENSFVSGGIDDKGKPIADAKRIRTVMPIKFDHAIFKERGEFEMSNPIKLNRSFDIYFYSSKNALISLKKGVKTRDILQLPDGASYAHLVFHQSGFKGAYIEQWNRALSTDVVVKNSEFGYNRRQGITVGGADFVLIQNNELHHMKGTMPQSGIDVEGGFGENGNRNSRIFIIGNKFHNNASYDVILYDGKDAVVEGNHMASKGAIGLAVSPPFLGALVKDNHFDATRIIAYHDVKFVNNRMNHSFTTLEGPNISIDGMEITDGLLGISAKQPNGVTATNVTIRSSDKRFGAGLSLFGKPVKLSNITIIGESNLRTVSGGAEPGSVIDNLKVIGYNSEFGLSLPPATYNNCVFEGAEGKRLGAAGISLGGKYVFNGCTFKSSSTAAVSLLADHPKLDLTVKNSTFELLGDTTAISVQAAANVLLENNKITAGRLTKENVELVKLNDYWKRTEKHDILKAVIQGNSIQSNLPAIGISTAYAGTGAPSYTIKNNILEKAVLALKANDLTEGNELKK